MDYQHWTSVVVFFYQPQFLAWFELRVYFNPFPPRGSTYHVRQSKITKWPVLAGLGGKGLTTGIIFLFLQSGKLSDVLDYKVPGMNDHF